MPYGSGEPCKSPKPHPDDLGHVLVIGWFTHDDIIYARFARARGEMHGQAKPCLAADICYSLKWYVYIDPVDVAGGGRTGILFGTDSTHLCLIFVTQ
jgi:hypothetical protein